MTTLERMAKTAYEKNCGLHHSLPSSKWEMLPPNVRREWLSIIVDALRDLAENPSEEMTDAMYNAKTCDDWISSTDLELMASAALMAIVEEGK